jgi:hypothetical protein
VDFHPVASQRQNGCASALVFPKFNARLVYVDGFLVVSVVTSTSTLIALLFQALFQWHPATISGEI